MDGVYGVLDRIFRVAVGAALLATVVSCAENVTSSAGCPALCADQSATLRDTTLFAVVVQDTTLLGFPALGESRELSLVSQGDTADLRIVARFDTIPNMYRIPGAVTDSVIRRVDSARFVFRVDTNFARPTVQFTIDAFDVDTSTANVDTLPKTLLPLFRPDRLIGSQTYLPAEVKDTMRLVLSDSAVLDKIKTGKRLRVGLRISSTQPVHLRLAGTLVSPRIRFRVSADTLVKPDTAFLRSFTPADSSGVAPTLALYQLVAKGELPPPPPPILAVGGVVGARSFLRFDIPGIVVDSVQIVRASLQLTQTPSRSLGANRDTLTIYLQAVVASPLVTNPRTAGQFLAPAGAFGIDTLRLVARDSGLRSYEMVRLVQRWRDVGAKNSARSIFLTASQEAFLAGEVNFFSFKAPLAVRPRLRLTYVPRRGFGLP